MVKRLLMTQALDERYMLIKKIHDKIDAASFVDVVKHHEDRVWGKRVSREDFGKEAERAYQQITDLIERYIRLDEAIVESNANTYIETSYGTYTMAAALSLRNRLRKEFYYEDGSTDFEMHLYAQMYNQYKEKLSLIKKKSKMELEDPLDVVKRMEELMNKKTQLLMELDTQIKVSNATTYIRL